MPKYRHDVHISAMIITVMSLTYISLSVLSVGLLMLNVGYFWSRMLMPGLLISSIGFGAMMFAAGLSQYTRSEDVILYSSNGGCFVSLAACAAQNRISSSSYAAR